MLRRPALPWALVIMFGCQRGATEVPAQAKGEVSVSFDDGYESAYRLALPIMDKYGLKATWYLISQRLGSNSLYLTRAEALALQADGQEIGGHTRNHFPLDTASDSLAQAEIGGGRDDLLAMGVRRLDTFAYPYGSYNSHTPGIVRLTGFATARGTHSGEQSVSSVQPYTLKAWCVGSEASLDQVIQALEQAVRDSAWYILCFHRVDEDGNPISVRHELIEGVAKYLSLNKVPVVTVSEGFKRLGQ